MLTADVFGLESFCPFQSDIANVERQLERARKNLRPTAGGKSRTPSDEINRQFEDFKFFKCNKCPATFHTGQEVQRHEVMEHFVLGERNFRLSCKVCNVDFQGGNSMAQNLFGLSFSAASSVPFWKLLFLLKCDQVKVYTVRKWTFGALFESPL